MKCLKPCVYKNNIFKCGSIDLEPTIYHPLVFVFLAQVCNSRLTIAAQFVEPIQRWAFHYRTKAGRGKRLLEGKGRLWWLRSDSLSYLLGNYRIMGQPCM